MRQKPYFRSDRNIQLCEVAWQHDRHTTVAVLWLQQLDGCDVRVEDKSIGSAELDEIGCSYLEVETVRLERDDNTAFPGHLEDVFNPE